MTQRPQFPPAGIGKGVLMHHTFTLNEATAAWALPKFRA
jgi:hypothetical protein